MGSKTDLCVAKLLGLENLSIPISPTSSYECGPFNEGDTALRTVYP